jgi:hypothetical protein
MADSFGLSVSHQEMSKAAAKSWPEAPDEAGWHVVWPLTVSGRPLVSTEQDMIIIAAPSLASNPSSELLLQTTPAAPLVSCTFVKRRRAVILDSIFAEFQLPKRRSRYSTSCSRERTKDRRLFRLPQCFSCRAEDDHEIQVRLSFGCPPF